MADLEYMLHYGLVKSLDHEAIFLNEVLDKADPEYLSKETSYAFCQRLLHPLLSSVTPLKEEWIFSLHQKATVARLVKAISAKHLELALKDWQDEEPLPDLVLPPSHMRDDYLFNRKARKADAAAAAKHCGLPKSVQSALEPLRFCEVDLQDINVLLGAQDDARPSIDALLELQPRMSTEELATIKKHGRAIRDLLNHQDMDYDDLHNSFDLEEVRSLHAVCEAD